MQKLTIFMESINFNHVNLLNSNLEIKITININLYSFSLSMLDTE